MKRSLCALCIAALLITAAVASAKPSTPVRLTVGQSHTIKVGQTITKVEVVAPRIVDVVRVKKTALTVKGLAVGQTTVRVYSVKQPVRKLIFVVTPKPKSKRAP
jgi:Flp pilus assembly secretin CpaC